MATGTTAKTVEVNGHTTRRTSPVVSWSKLVSGWRAEISATLWARASFHPPKQ